MSKQKQNMDYKNSLNKFALDDIAKDIQVYIDGNLHLKSFFNYLKSNKIEFQVIEKVKNSFFGCKFNNFRS